MGQVVNTGEVNIRLENCLKELKGMIEETEPFISRSHCSLSTVQQEAVNERTFI